MAEDFIKIKDSTSLPTKVEKLIKEAIIAKKYLSGEQLPGEIELSKKLGVSRSVVREAIKSLCSLGFLEIRRGINSGTYVSDLNKLYFKENFVDLIRLGRLSIKELTQARLFLEPEVVRLTIENATEQDLELINQNLKDYDSADGIDQKVSLGGLFHKLIAKACGNPLYSFFMDSIMDFSEAFIKTTQPETKAVGNTHEHKGIFEAIKNRDAEKAYKLTVHHINVSITEMQKMEKTYLRLLEKGS